MNRITERVLSEQMDRINRSEVKYRLDRGYAYRLVDAETGDCLTPALTSREMYFILFGIVISENRATRDIEK